MTKLGLALLGIAFIGSSQANDEFKMYPHPTQLIVEVEDETLSLNSFVGEMDIRPLHRSDRKKNLFLVNMNSFVEASSLVSQIESSPEVVAVYPNYVYEGNFHEFTPNDGKLSFQNHHKIIGSEKAWAHDLGKKEVIVAVTDDGFNLAHEDLQETWHKNHKEIPGNGIDDDNNGYIDDVIGWDFNEGDNDPSSDEMHGNHGTHVAGIVAGSFDNGIGISGMSPMIKVMPLKFYGENRWTSAMVYETYRYAVENGAKIISTSYNIDWFVKDDVYKKALNYMDKKGVIFFNSAGNSGRLNPPRVKFEKVLLVGSTKSENSGADKKSRFSNYGHGIDIVAPGDPIYSTVKSGRYGNMSGTSMATPVAAGLAAYIWSVNPEFTREQVVAKLYTSSKNIDEVNDKYLLQLGAGRVDAATAITEEVKPLTVEKAWFERSSKTLHVKFKGVLAKGQDLTDVIKVREDKNRFNLSFEQDQYFLGTNTFTAKLERRGQFKIILRGEDFLDPFGQELDGNNDGIAGGDFEMDIKTTSW